MATVMPSPEEYADLVPTPDSPVWRYAGDARLIGTGAYAILLQVGHPTVGAGVSEFSEFRADPWGRLFRTLDYSYTMTYGGPQAAGEMGQRIRNMHKGIKGTKPDGERYSALEPEAYAWVHATLAHSIVRGLELLARPIPEQELDRFYEDWRNGGRLIGVRDRDMPKNWAEFNEYFEEMCGQLQRTAAVVEVLESLEDPAKPPLPFLSDRAWRIARIPAIRQTSLITAGLLSPQLRARFGVEWNQSRARQLRLVAGASRAMTPLIPGRLRNVGPAYLRWRREALERGDVANPERAPVAVAA